MVTNESQSYLNQYVTERLPQLLPGAFEDDPEAPGFTIDRRFIPFDAPLPDQQPLA